MKLYISFLLFFVTMNNGMHLIEKIYSISQGEQQPRTKWRIDTEKNQGTFKIRKYGQSKILGKLRVSFLTVDNQFIDEIRIDEIEGYQHCLSYLLYKYVEFARANRYAGLCYHDFSHGDSHEIIDRVFLNNDFTKKLIRSNLGNKKSADDPVEHYFYEKRL